MNKEADNRFKHFVALKSKYQATNYQDSSPSSLLYLILRKVDLGIEVTELELSWLKEQGLLKTIKIISQKQEYNLQEINNLENEFERLKSQYRVPKHKGGVQKITNTLFPILWKLNTEKYLNTSEIEWLKNYQLVATLSLLRNIELEREFDVLKSKYQANKYEGSSPNSPLYKILRKLENNETISYPLLEWLKKRELFETIKIYEQQEAKKQRHFAELKRKYHANQYTDVSLSNPLYPILQKLDHGEKLIETELKWLENQGLTETITIIQELEQAQKFAILKDKYKANKYDDTSPKSHLYQVLKRLE